MYDLKRAAPLIAELLANAGWLDDGDELIADHLEHDGYESAMAKAIEVEALVEAINPHLPEGEKITEFDLQQYL